MHSPYKRIIVYDLETGGLNHKFNSITEMAAVAIDLENLEILEEFTVMLQPRLDLKERDVEPIKEAKVLYKNLATKDTETGSMGLKYKAHQITLKNLEPLSEDIEEFYKFLAINGDIITYSDYLKLKEQESFSNIVEMFFNKTYNPQALEVTHISREMLLNEGVGYEEAFEGVSEFFKRHVVGNNLPILAGHNIKKFDNPFLETFFESNNNNLKYFINQTQMIDTLEWARLRWFELSGYNLGICANEVGLTLKEAHRALPDTVANAKFLIKMLQNLRGEGSQESTYVKRKYKFNF
jgi:DNA polymerase III alpha subunit (gram-positive type)